MRRLAVLVLVVASVSACKAKPKWTEDQKKGSGSSGAGPTDTPPSKPPIEANGKALGGMTMLSVGLKTACAYGDKQLWCWEPGQPATAVPVPGGAEVLGLAGAECAILETGGLWCWTPKEMKADANVQSGGQISAYGDEVCTAHRMDVRCWKLGNPEPHAKWGWAGVDRIQVSEGKVCSAISGGTVECSDITQEKPDHVPVPGPENIDELSMAGNISCAVLEKTGEVACWTDPRKVTKVPGVKGVRDNDPAAISVGPTGKACAIVSGGVTCWDVSAGGAIDAAGIATIGGVGGAKAVGVGAEFGCALAGDKVLCWGKASKDPATGQAVSKK